MSSESTGSDLRQTPLTQYAIKVLLVDDQPFIGEAVRRMLASEADIRLHYCQDPSAAIRMAEDIHPTVILQDLVMPDIDGLTLVKFFRAHPQMKDTPLIVLSTKEEPTTKAEAFARGANDYLVKLPDKIELIARIRHHSKGYINLLQRNEAFARLAASQQALAAELAEAAAYVQSLLPPPLTAGPIHTTWQFIPSTQLGGDAFGYHWLDSDHFCMFLLDVCGHGVGAALLSISAMNVLRSRALPNTDFREPGAMLSALNEAFLMEKHNNMYFTIWYGVYRPSTRVLQYASAGHPPALLIPGGGNAADPVKELRGRGLVLGGISGVVYRTETCVIPEHSSLFLLSDGTYEITRTDGTLWSFEEFRTLLATAHRNGSDEMAALLQQIHAMRGEGSLEDDFSLVKFRF